MANLYNKAGLINIPVGYSDGFLYNIKPTDNTLGFRFDRASAATRVNEQGLIEQVGYFGPELVQNGNFSELGTELVVNGNFDTDSDWTKLGNWTISNGKLSTSGGASLVYQNITSGINKTYKVVFEVSDYVSGQVTVGFGGALSNPIGQYVNANGIYTQYLTKTDTNLSFGFRPDNFIGSIDNVSVKEVDPNDRWDADGWSISDVASSTGNGTTQYLGQVADIVSGKTYKVTYTVLSNSLSNNRLIMSVTSSFYSTQIPSNVGTNTVFLTAVTSSPSSGYGIRFANSANNASGSISIDNVSVQEVLGDKPRIDYTDSLTSPSFLLEPQRTNIITYSEDFSDSSWSKIRGGIGSFPILDFGYTSPEGALNATKITLDKGSSTSLSDFSGLKFEFTEFDGVVSIYLKGENGGEDVTLLARGVDLGTFTLTSEWVRYEVYSSQANQLTLRIRGDINVNNVATFYAWGAQVEQGSYATSYIPTAGSTVTRAQETCSGAGNASTFNDSEGVLYAEIAALADDGTNRRINISDGGNSNVVRLGYTANLNQVIGVIAANGVQAAMTYTLNNASIFNKIAVKYKQNDFALWVNGFEVATDIIGSTPVGLSTLEFDLSGIDYFYGKVKGIYAFNKALTDDELQQLTGPEYNSFAALAAAYNYTVI